MFAQPKTPKLIPFMLCGAAIGMLLFGIFKLGQASVTPQIEYVEVPIIKAPEGPVKVRPYVKSATKCPAAIVVQEPPKRIDK